MDPEVLQHWVEEIDHVIWQGDAAGSSDAALAALLVCCGAFLTEVLRELPDESLALAVRLPRLKKAAFEELLVTRYTAQLGRWFRGWGTEGNEADDLTQEIFVKLYSDALRTFDPTIAAFCPFLHKVAFNLWHQRVYRPRRPVPLQGAASVPARGPGPEAFADLAELEARLEEALQRLPPEERRVLRGTMEGRAAAELAGQMDEPIARVYRLLFRARRLLKRELGLGPVVKARGRHESRA